MQASSLLKTMQIDVNVPYALPVILGHPGVRAKGDRLLYYHTASSGEKGGERGGMHNRHGIAREWHAPGMSRRRRLRQPCSLSLLACSARMMSVCEMICVMRQSLSNSAMRWCTADVRPLAGTRRRDGWSRLEYTSSHRDTPVCSRRSVRQTVRQTVWVVGEAVWRVRPCPRGDGRRCEADSALRDCAGRADYIRELGLLEEHHSG